MRAPHLLFLAAMAAGTPALAQGITGPEPLPAENGRFVLTPVEKGFLRLDTRTGAVSLCTVTGQTAECHPAADDLSMADRVQRLRPNDQGAQQPPAALSQSRDDRDMQRAMDFAEMFMRRMIRIMRDETKNPT